MRNLFNLNCRDVARIVSDSMDHPLPLTQKLKVRIHLAMCKYCARFAKQMHFLRKICQEQAEPPSDAALPDEARHRIHQAVRSSLKK